MGVFVLFRRAADFVEGISLFGGVVGLIGLVGWLVVLLIFLRSVGWSGLVWFSCLVWLVGLVGSSSFGLFFWLICACFHAKHCVWEKCNRTGLGGPPEVYIASRRPPRLSSNLGGCSLLYTEVWGAGASRTRVGVWSSGSHS